MRYAESFKVKVEDLVAASIHHHAPRDETREKLLAFYDAELALRGITAQLVVEGRQFLKAGGISEAAIKTHCGNAKTIFNEAVRRRLIECNPFASLPSEATPNKHSRYVTPEEIARVIDACPDLEWKLLFGPARYAGLRIRPVDRSQPQDRAPRRGRAAHPADHSKADAAAPRSFRCVPGRRGARCDGRRQGGL